MVWTSNYWNWQLNGLTHNPPKTNGLKNLKITLNVKRNIIFQPISLSGFHVVKGVWLPQIKLPGGLSHHKPDTKVLLQSIASKTPSSSARKSSSTFLKFLHWHLIIEFYQKMDRTYSTWILKNNIWFPSLESPSWGNAHGFSFALFGNVDANCLGWSCFFAERFRRPGQEGRWRSIGGSLYFSKSPLARQDDSWIWRGINGWGRCTSYKLQLSMLDTI